MQIMLYFYRTTTLLHEIYISPYLLINIKIKTITIINTKNPINVLVFVVNCEQNNERILISVQLYNRKKTTKQQKNTLNQ